MSNPFKLLKDILAAWNTATIRVISNAQSKKEEDPKSFTTHSNKLIDSDCLLFLGYVSKLSEKIETRAMQSIIVNTLAPSNEYSEKERNKVRQEIKRRADTFVFFNLMSREYLNAVAVEFKLTDEGEALLKHFNDLMEGDNND